MDDHTQKSDQNQINQETPMPLQQEKVVPEETPAEVTLNQQTPTEFVPPVASEAHHDSRTKFILIGGGILLFFVLFFILLGVILGSGKKKNVALTYWGLWEDASIMQPFLDDYNKKNPNVKITYTKMSPQDYRDKLITRSKAGAGPDIFRFHNTWLPEIKDVASPLPSSVLTNAEFDSTFYSIHQKDLKVSGRYYGIPLMVDGLVLVYNDELFKKAGITTPPVTWDDVLSDVEKLTVRQEDGTLVTAGIALGSATNVEHNSDLFGLFLYQNGGSIENLKSAEAEGALQSYRAFAEGTNGFWNDQMPNSIDAFVQEKVAMIIVPSWEVLSIKTSGQNPSLKMAVAPVPIVPASNALSLASYWVEGVSKMSKNQVEAWKFLKFMSEKEQLTKLFELQSKVRAFGYAYPRQDMADLLSSHPYLGPVVLQAKNNGYISSPLISRTYDNGMDDQISDYINQSVQASADGVAYADALQTAALGVDQVFTQFRVK